MDPSFRLIASSEKNNPLVGNFTIAGNQVRRVFRNESEAEIAQLLYRMYQSHEQTPLVHRTVTRQTTEPSASAENEDSNKISRMLQTIVGTDEEQGKTNSLWSVCRGRIGYPNGDLYTGCVKDGFPDGEGSMVYANGDRYIGSFSGGRKSGFGVFIFKNGDSLTGMFAQDHFPNEGFMRKMLDDGNLYEGFFKDGKPHGEGNLYDPQGKLIRKGRFSEGHAPVERQAPVEGFVRKTLDDGTYEGLLREGKPHGKGKLYDSQGKLVYQGMFSDGKISFGTMFFSNGLIYTGDFLNGQCHGYGELRFRDGHSYTGFFSNGRCEGSGVIADGKGNILIANFFGSNFVNGHVSAIRGRDS